MENNLNENGGTFNSAPQTPPKNYLVESILVTVLCCLPFGIMGIINATKVESLYAAGDYESSQRAADDAKKFCKYGLIGWGVVVVIYVILMLAGVAAGIS
ncbi:MULTISPECIES: CD225/dispanin family protein [unclassified Dysgonomonas]|uniref:CD225/dispanin family protein n=1 Tax=unclassified Dysgonomonas TaxID=2630389 RepID=UPI0013EA52F0|nr:MULTISPECIES: CD225/dispanin family protein [unclassified Dysgonomonas]